MTLKEYIEDMGPGKLAEVLGTTYSVVVNWRNYYSVPKPETARKIVKLSGGIINYVDIYEPYFRHLENRPLKNYREEYTQLSFNL